MKWSFQIQPLIKELPNPKSASDIRHLCSEQNHGWFKRAANVSSNFLSTWTIMLNNFVIVFLSVILFLCKECIQRPWF